ncbi:hypothetical protein CQ12_31820 [Bradyrhizobium jicamae]|uniref:Uncharacterized protein n=1 Tax=Bradyrhizobium jicamae TaxID=280332 RepID=A0A0R3LWZ5_9BRAD|nr:hypothetical protein CQ12_31820 [Bradyrhizobium jicamae]
MSHFETMQIFFRCLKPWEDNLRGLNVIFDLGIFFGECVIARTRACTGPTGPAYLTMDRPRPAGHTSRGTA